MSWAAKLERCILLSVTWSYRKSTTSAREHSCNSKLILANKETWYIIAGVLDKIRRVKMALIIFVFLICSWFYELSPRAVNLNERINRQTQTMGVYWSRCHSERRRLSMSIHIKIGLVLLRGYKWIRFFGGRNLFIYAKKQGNKWAKNDCFKKWFATKENRIDNSEWSPKLETPGWDVNDFMWLWQAKTYR